MSEEPDKLTQLKYSYCRQLSAAQAEVNRLRGILADIDIFEKEANREISRLRSETTGDLGPQCATVGHQTPSHCETPSEQAKYKGGAVVNQQQDTNRSPVILEPRCYPFGPGGSGGNPESQQSKAIA